MKGHVKSTTPMLKRIVTLAAIGSLLILTAGFKACPKSERDRNVAYARDISGAFRSAADLVAASNPGAAAKMRRGADISDRLATAFANSDSDSIAGLIKDILPIFTEVAREFSNNRTVLLALALGQIALNFFVNHFLQTAQLKGKVSAAAAGPEVVEFLALPQFGCELKPERCR